MVPLTLALGPVEVSPPGQTKKTVYIMHIKKDIILAELARIAQLPLGRVLIPEPETDEPPEDLYHEGVIGESASAQPGTAADVPWEAIEKLGKTEGEKRDPESIKTGADLLQVCLEDFNLQEDAVYAELNINSLMELAETPADAYRRIAAARE